jgi:inner membrane protein
MAGLDAFWLWLILGLVLLGIEVFFTTQWLLWSAASAGIVAVITLLHLAIGPVGQVALFLSLSLVCSLLSRRFMKSVPETSDVNDSQARLIGQYATIISGFEPEQGTMRFGRVLIDGVEWPALWAPGSQAEQVPNKAKIEKIVEGKLYLKA